MPLATFLTFGLSDLARAQPGQPGILPPNNGSVITEISLACANGSVAGQWIELVPLFQGELVDTSTFIRAYDRNDALLGSVWPVRSALYSARMTRSLITTRFVQSIHYPDYPYGEPPDYAQAIADALLPFVMDRERGRLEVWVRDSGTETLALVQDLRYGPGGWPAPPPGTSLEQLAPERYAIQTSPVPEPSRYMPNVVNKGCASPRLAEVFMTCRSGTPGVSYVAIEPPATIPYFLDYQPDWGAELRVLDAQGSETSRDHVLVSPYGDRLDRFPYLATSPSFEDRFGSAGDSRLGAALDPTGGRVQLGWTTPGGGFEVFDELAYGPNDVPAPAVGRSLVHNATGDWLESTPQPMTRWGRTFSDLDCFDVGRPSIAFQEIFPACLCGKEVSFAELVNASPRILLESGVALIAFDRTGVERWRAENVFSSRVGTYWDQGETWLLATAGTRAGLLDDHTYPDCTVPGDLDPDGGYLTLVRAAGTPAADTLASFAYGPGTPHPAPQRGASLALQPDGSYAEGPPTPLVLGATTPSFSYVGLRTCLGTGFGVPIRQVLWSCVDGSGSVSYLNFYSSSFPSYPEDQGVRAFDRHGSLLFSMDHPFAALRCQPIANRDGFHWLLASEGYRQLTGQDPDAVMPVSLDPVAGRVETYVPTPTGETVTWSYSYPPADAITPGYAGLPGNPARMGFARPVRSDGRVLSAPGCVEDGPPAIRIGEILLRCGDGTPDGHYVQLEKSGEDEFHDPRLQLTATDRGGRPLWRLAPLASAIDGRLLTSSDALLIAHPGLEASLGLVPDAILPDTLDAVGGTLRLEWLREQNATPVALDVVDYGPGLRFSTPPAGMALRPHDEQRRDLHYLALPRNLAKSRPTEPACFTDSCSALAFESRNLHLAYPDSIQGSYADCSPSYCGYKASYDWTTLSLRIEVGGISVSRSVVAHDDFVAQGLPYGTPVSFDLELKAGLNGFEEGDCVPFSCLAHSGTGAAALSVAGQEIRLAAKRYVDTTVTRRVTVRAGEPFRLSMSCSVILSNGDWSQPIFAAAAATLTPLNLPAGVSLHSCWGYDSDDLVAIDVVLAGASATRDAVKLEWRTSLGGGFSALLERRASDGVWLSLATLTADGVGALHYEDRAVRVGETYDYRLRWERGGSTHTSDITSLTIPEAPRFAFRGARPNPARGNILLDVVLEEGVAARLELFDVSGRRVAEQRLALEPGEHRISVDAVRRLPSGIYMAKLRQGSHETMQRVVLLP